MRRGDVVDEIVAAIRERSHDLLVLSTHGQSGIEGILSGSIAGRLLGRLTIPVLLVRRFDRPHT